ncbi:hypothetical protein B0O99DRAFT_692920 [Bisporella sp. PMI_857]|nr:hypothetical protein B0O99DRAFT_692920 [Bisporella sp. PMI_857]
MNLVTALSATSFIVGIVGSLQVAATIQTYPEATLEADDHIRDIANDINATRPQRSNDSKSHAKGIPEADKKRDKVIDNGKVDDFLVKYTTTFKEGEQPNRKAETERQKKQQEKKDESMEFSSSDEDRLGEQLL